MLSLALFDPIFIIQNNQGTLVQDFYSIELQNFIYSIVNAQNPPFIQQQPDPQIRGKLIKKMKQFKKVYTVQYCKQKKYHITILSTEKSVPMLLRSLNILQTGQGNDKDAAELIKRIQRQYDYYSLNFLKKYAYQYVASCRESGVKVIDKVPYWDTHTLDIYKDIKQAKESCIKISEQIDRFEDVGYDYINCPYDCENDHYDSTFKLIQDIYLGNKKRKDLKLNLCEKRKMNRILEECKIIKCQRNTKHLWRIGYQYRNKNKNMFQHLTEFDVYKRVPMEKEKIIVAKILHGQNHRNYQKMLQALTKLPFIYSSIKIFLQTSSTYCNTCPRLARRRDISGYSQFLSTTSAQCSSIDKANQSQSNRQWQRKHKFLKRLQKDQLSMNTDELLIKTHITENGRPNVIVICTRKMQSHYHQFGECLYFESFSHFIDTKECWQTFFFSGVDQSKNQVLFGTCLIDESSFEAFFYAFTMFFELMWNQYPHTICTTFSTSLNDSLNSLIFYSQQQKLRRVKHFCFWKSAVSTFMEMIKEQNCSNGLISFFIEAMKTKCKRKYNQSMKQLELQLGKQSKSLKLLNILKQKLCWIELTPSFVSSGLQYTRTQNVLKILRPNLSPCTTSTQFVNDFKRIKQISYQNNLAHTLKYQAPQLQAIYDRLGSKIRSQLTQRCIMSYKIVSIERVTQISVVVSEEDGIFKLEYLLEHDHWQCQCLQIYKSGLPCSHLIRILKQMGGDIGYYVNQRWMADYI